MKFIFLLIGFFSVLVIRAQNVGIGMAAPIEKLDVAGNIKADTLKPSAIKFIPGAANGKVLTSDAAGNAGWQSAAASGTGVGFGLWGDCSVTGISDYNPTVEPSNAAGDQFGRAVSVSGNFAIVGAYLDDVGANANQGSASLYQYDGSNWLFVQKITDPTGAADDYFGYSVSISGNFAAVGAYADDIGANASQGSVCIFYFNGSDWVFMQRLTDAAGAAGDLFGIDVIISGNRIITGASGDDVGANASQGSACIFQFNGSSWGLMQKIIDAAGAADDNFGRAVSVSGNYVIVGASADDVGTNANQGSALIYQYVGTTWQLLQKIIEAGGAAADNFGLSVSISGNYAIIGIQGDAVVGNASQGSAGIYQYNGTAWNLMQIVSDAAGVAGDNFGQVVAISGSYAVIGCPRDGIGLNDLQGSATVYLRMGQGWQKVQYITDPGGNASDNFGGGLAIDGTAKRFLIGAPRFANFSGKVVFGKIN